MQAARSRNAEAINIRGGGRMKAFEPKVACGATKSGALSGFGVFRPLCGATIDN
jgi:hypothetical protein